MYRLIFIVGILTVGSLENNFQRIQDRRKFLTYIAENHKIGNLSLIGSHVSAGYDENTWANKNQDFNISKQLEFGVRVLDIGLRSTSNRFAVHNGIHYLNLMFGKVLKIVKEFLILNPREFVIVLIHQVHFAASDVTKSNCEILASYNAFGSDISINWLLSDEIWKHRGKILLASSDNSFQKCVQNLFSQCKVSEEKPRNHWDLITEKQWKYKELVELQEASFVENHKCFVNVIASRDNNFARRLAIEDSHFPHVGYESSINHQMATYFRNPRRALVIVMADFVTQELIDRVNFSNDFDYFSTNKSLAKISN